MINPIKITLTTAGANTESFSLFSDADGYVTPFAMGITKAQLLAGYVSGAAPDLTTIVRVKSNSACMNSIDLVLIHYILLEFTDINVVVTALGITDINDVSQWNTYFNTHYAVGINFTSLSVDANTIKFYGNLLSITNFSFNGSTLVRFDSSTSLLGVTYFDINKNSVVIFDPESALPEGLTELYINYNPIVEFNPTLPLPNSLMYFAIDHSYLATFNPALPLPTSLIYLDLSFTNLVEFNPTIPLPSGLQTLKLQFNNITNTNEILAYFVSINKTGFTLKLNYGTSVAPTGQGIIDKQTLIDNGNTILTN